MPRKQETVANGRQRERRDQTLRGAVIRLVKGELQQTTAMHRLVVGIMILAATCLVATTGYMYAGWGLVDAIYMVTITIFGVGFGEVQPITTPTLKIFTVLVIVTGCSSGIYVVGGILQMITEGEVKRLLGDRNRSRDIEDLCDHVIICGYGRVGKMLAEELTASGDQLVIVDRDQTRIDEAAHDGLLAVCGDAAEDEVLHRVGIERARSLATVLPKDEINVFITLSARDLNDTIQIVARAECPSTERKLIRSGACRVVMPAAIGAVRIAQLVSDSGPPKAAADTDSADIGHLKSDLDEITSLREDVASAIDSVPVSDCTPGNDHVPVTDNVRE